MAYVICDGKGKKVGLYAACLDITYAQAEILLMAEKVKLDHPDAFVVGFLDSQIQMTVDRFLDALKKYPSDLERVQELRTEILAKGFNSFVLRSYVDQFEDFLKTKPLLQVSRSLDSMIDQLTDFKLGVPDVEVTEIVEDIFANPLHTGVHQEFRATVSDETWIADATKSIRRMTPERWLRRLLAVMRFYFKGQPIVPLPHKNDRCPCDSNRKYGKCCGLGVEHADPEDCKLGKHEFSAWQKVESRYVRTCERCYRVYNAPWFDESTFEGVKVTVIGCGACSQKPTPEDLHAEIGRAMGWQTCGACGKPFTLDTLLIEHAWADGKHSDHWISTEITHREETADLESKALGKGIFIHRECFEKALPAWPVVAKGLGERALAADITREISPAKP